MSHELNAARMDYLSLFKGVIELEEVEERGEAEMVIRIPMSREMAEETYYELGRIS